MCFNQKGVPKVSVLIPCYQHEAYIVDTLHSVLSQTMTDFEILIADDSSKDCSAARIQSVTDERMKSYFFVKNQGTVRTLNFLLQRARGEYIATLGSDDLFHPEKLARQCAVLDAEPDIGAVFSWADMVDENGEQYQPDDSIFSEVFSEPIGFAIPARWCVKVFMMHWVDMIRRIVSCMILSIGPGSSA